MLFVTTFTVTTGKIIADWGWAGAIGVYAHSFNLLTALAEEPLKLGDLEIAQHGLLASIVVGEIVNLHFKKI